MMRVWIGVALLAVSWLLGQTYYYPAKYLAWPIVVVAGAVLLSGEKVSGTFFPKGAQGAPQRRSLTPFPLIAMVLLVPAVWFAPWPLRAAPLLIIVGLALQLLPIPRRWPRPLGQGAVTAGVVMFGQALCLAVYASHTARSHELPWPLPDLLAGIACLLGMDATADGSTVVMHSVRQVHRLGATWGLLLDPATLCFFVGGLAMFGLTAWARLPGGRRWKAWIGGLRSLTLVVLAWLPIRAGLLMALYLHRVLRSDYELPLHVMNLFLSAWVHLLLLAGPVLLAWRFVHLPIADQPESVDQRGRFPAGRPGSWHYPAAAVLVLLAAAVFTVAIRWDPVGRRKDRRVKVVERHSTWEPTTRPYDTKWFGHDSGYNYAAIYDYLSQFFKMSQLLEDQKIDLDALNEDCDVLVIKTPTRRYSEDEVEAVVEFVRGGGGLLLVGDHTNFERSSTYMNDITRQMGFTFRHDLLFGYGESPYDQLYRPPRVPHPVVQHLPPTDFAVSCSIDPGESRGRAVIQSTGLWSLPPDYHISNYHTVPQHRPDMRCGAFIQLWSTRFGKGRVLAFTDSTIFSNFCIYQPGKAELMLGMIEWLNHRDRLGEPRPWLLLVGLLPLAAGLWLARSRDEAWLVLLAAGTCGWVVASVTVAAVHRRSMPVPKPEVGQRMTRVVIDRTTSDVPLSKGAYTQGEGEGYGLLEQWISRLGYYTTRRSGPDTLTDDTDAVVVICPSRSVSRQFRDQLVEYVKGGGRLLVIDSPENTASTANSLLWPFGLSMVLDQAWRGKLTMAKQKDWPAVQIERAREIAGGRPIARIGQLPVAAEAPREKTGKGSVMAVGFGSLFNDANMGDTWMTDPNEEMLDRFDVPFALVRSLVEDQPILPPPPRTPAGEETAGEEADPQP